MLAHRWWIHWHWKFQVFAGWKPPDFHSPASVSVATSAGLLPVRNDRTMCHQVCFPQVDRQQQTSWCGQVIDSRRHDRRQYRYLREY